MPAVQSTYNARLAVGYAGQVADLALRDQISREVETPGGIGFGLAVIRGTNDHGCKLGADGDFLGLTIRDITLDSTRNDKFAQYDTAGILQKGAMWVNAVKACVPGDGVYRTPTGTLTNVIGSRTATSAAKAGGNAANTGTMGAITVTGAIPDGVYQLRITATATDAGTFVITDPQGQVIGPAGTVGVAYSFGGLAFTLADGTQDFIVGEGFDITVTGGNVLIPNARWETTASADGDIAKIRLL
jgi:hypothetical protein